MTQDSMLAPSMVAVGLAIFGPTTLSSHGQSINNLGILPGQNLATPTSVSADGSVVAGTTYNGEPGGARAFRWTLASGMQPMPFPYSFTGVVSGDASTIVGQGIIDSQPQGYRWTATGGATGLGFLPGSSQTLPVAVSANGSAAAGYDYGLGYDRAWRWTAAGGIQDLGRLATAWHTHATAISGDGSVVVGWNLTPDGGAQGWRWTQAGLLDLSALPGGGFDQAFGVSADGSVIVGNGTSPEGGGAVRWTASTGITGLGVPLGFSSASAQAVSGDGRVAAGVCDGGRACYWAPGVGAVDLNAYLPTIGVSLSGWVLFEATALNADGSVVVGYGSFNGEGRAWIVTIPSPGAALLMWTAFTGIQRPRVGRSREGGSPRGSCSRTGATRTAGA
jgi:uncharacterized membrane protein